MKKLVLSILFLLGFVVNSYATGTVGITLSSADIKSTVKDDIDSNGTTDTTKNISNDLSFASVFFELTGIDNQVSNNGVTWKRFHFQTAV